jgi:hypothetical protein
MVALNNFVEFIHNAIHIRFVNVMRYPDIKSLNIQEYLMCGHLGEHRLG